MELEITENNSNPLLHRQELQMVIKHDTNATPRRKEVIKNLSKTLKAKINLIIIDKLNNKYGKSETHGYAKIYSSSEALKKIETKPSIARHNFKEEKTQKTKEVKEKPEEKNKSVKKETKTTEENKKDEEN